MNKQALFVLMAVFLLSGFVIAQKKIVTNADLEKYRQKRLKEEKNLRENYASLGFDSPAVIAKQNAQSRRELNEYATRLRQDQIERQERQNDVVYLEDNYRRNYSNGNSNFIDYRRYYSLGYYNNYRTRRYRNRGNRRYKRSKDFRQRFINGLPGYVLRNHRFNRFNHRRIQKPFRRGKTKNRRRR